jgi:hypothetical protein
LREDIGRDPLNLPILAALRDECRSFEEVIRVWTLNVLSGVER